MARGALKRDPTLQAAVYAHFVVLTGRKPPGKRSVTKFQYLRCACTTWCCCPCRPCHLSPVSPWPFDARPNSPYTRCRDGRFFVLCAKVLNPSGFDSEEDEAVLVQELQVRPSMHSRA